MDCEKDTSPYRLFLCWPGQRHLPKGVGVGLGVNEGRVDVTMAQHIGNRLDGRVMRERANRPGVAEAARAAAGSFDAGLFEMAANDHGDGDTVQRTEGCFYAEKDLAG